jgi:hypothetical protein
MLSIFLSCALTATATENIISKMSKLKEQLEKALPKMSAFLPIDRPTSRHSPTESVLDNSAIELASYKPFFTKADLKHLLDPEYISDLMNQSITSMFEKLPEETLKFVKESKLKMTKESKIELYAELLLSYLFALEDAIHIQIESGPTESVETGLFKLVELHLEETSYLLLIVSKMHHFEMKWALLLCAMSINREYIEIWSHLQVQNHEAHPILDEQVQQDMKIFNAFELKLERVVDDKVDLTRRFCILVTCTHSMYQRANDPNRQESINELSTVLTNIDASDIDVPKFQAKVFLKPHESKIIADTLSEYSTLIARTGEDDVAFNRIYQLTNIVRSKISMLKLWRIYTVWDESPNQEYHEMLHKFLELRKNLLVKK